MSDKKCTTWNVHVVMMALLMPAILLSCKKEYEQYNYTGIYSFSFTDTANSQSCIASINTSAHLIEVNWLYEWKSIDSIEPVITLPPGATIEPASGRRIAFGDGVTYTVTAQNGTQQVYTLKKIWMQPKPAFVFYNDSLSLRQGTTGTATALNVINDTAISKLFMVNRNTQVTIRVPLTSITEQGIAFSVPATIETGYYTLRLISGLHTVDAAVVCRVFMPVPVVTATNPTVNIKKGDLITFTGTGFSEIAEVWCSTTSSGTYYRFPVVSQTATGITVQVPDNAIPGTYTYTRMISPGTGSNTISLTATGKKFTVAS